ncbi:MAG: glycoside hydrolase family 15 protein [Planctomycetota bacterium]
MDECFHVRTQWRGLEVTDYLDCSGGRPMQRAGRTDLVRVIEGSGRVRVEFAPRLDFGRQPTRLRVHPEGVEVEDTPDPIVLRSPGVEWTLLDEGAHQTAVAEIEVDGGPIVLELRYGSGSLGPTVVSESQRRRQTERYWRDWAEGLELPHMDEALLRRSALVLRGLVYGPTGAIAAAGTTSLPETIGGVRNWDYRYCWPRDASMSAATLVRVGSNAEAMRLLDWLLTIVDTLASPDRLQPIYTVTGQELGSEAEISELSGYRGSRPVRVGNAASRQLQLDVFGPVVDLVHALAQAGAPLSGEHWRLVESAVTAVQRRWEEPDHGIWEVRGPRRHYTHSKAMCWLAVDRGIKVAEQLLGRERSDWIGLRDHIARDVLERGFRSDLNAYTMAYGEHQLDAGTLLMGTIGLIEPHDPRFVGTVEAIEHSLREGPTVYRYRTDDGLPGDEGGFHICTGWLIEAYAACGRMDDARALYRELVGLAGPTGLYSEEWMPGEELALGNHPQAYSHLALLNAAICLDASG